MKDLKALIRPSLLNLKPYSSAREEYTESNGIFLDANENPFGELNRYPDPKQKALKKVLAELKSVAAESVFIGNGSDEIIDLAFRLFCEPGMDKALTCVPTYGMYEVSAAINHVELVQCALNADFQLDWSRLAEALKDASIKVIILCSPNNPTGNSIRGIEKLVQEFSGIVFVDEAYIDFSEQESLVKRITDFPNLVVIQTLSKAWGLAAARIGVAYTNPAIVGWLNRIKPPYNVSELNQRAALEILNKLDSYRSTVALLLAERKRLELALGNMEVVVRVFPSDANFLLVEVSDADRVYDFLVSKGVITRNRNSVVRNCIRVTVGAPDENNKLIEALNSCKA